MKPSILTRVTFVQGVSSELRGGKFCAQLDRLYCCFKATPLSDRKQVSWPGWPGLPVEGGWPAGEEPRQAPPGTSCFIFIYHRKAVKVVRGQDI